MGMNFFGLHTYPENSVGPEPLAWIGRPEDILDGGNVKFSYPARHFSISGTTGGFGYQRSGSSRFSFGAAALSTATIMGRIICATPCLWKPCRPSNAIGFFDDMGDF